MNPRTLSFLVVIAGSTFPALADTIHVAPCGDDAWTGASPVCAAPDGPKRTIQAGIDASADGDTVLVADGTYTGLGNRDMDFGGRAITLRGAGGPEECFIDCQGTEAEPHRAFHFQSGETTTSVLEGFTIQNAFEPTDIGFGGAVICEFGAPLIQDCVFRNNRTYAGGAIYVGSSGVVLTRCLFEGNTATNSGGAIAVDAGPIVFTDCSFRNNSTTNPAAGGGGAIACGSVSVIFDRCLFEDNTAARLGGGVWAAQCLATLTDCKFIGNSAPSRAGGCGLAFGTDATLVNCLFAGNAGPAALWVGNGVGDPSSVTVTNCTFGHNTLGAGGAALSVTQTSTVTAANCVLWGSTPQQIAVEPGASLALSFSDVQGGWMGTDNIDADPLFADPAENNYRLSPFSPCIDSGDNTALPAGVTSNLDGNPRLRDDPWTPDTGIAGGAGGSVIVDMGAYEFQGSSCRADLNGDGLVDFSDYLEFLNFYDAGDPRADFNGDGLVDFSDYLEFLNHFDAGC